MARPPRWPKMAQRWLPRWHRHETPATEGRQGGGDPPRGAVGVDVVLNVVVGFGVNVADLVVVVDVVGVTCYAMPYHAWSAYGKSS